MFGYCGWMHAVCAWCCHHGNCIMLMSCVRVLQEACTTWVWVVHMYYCCPTKWRENSQKRGCQCCDTCNSIKQSILYHFLFSLCLLFCFYCYYFFWLQIISDECSQTFCCRPWMWPLHMWSFLLLHGSLVSNPCGRDCFGILLCEQTDKILLRAWYYQLYLEAY